MNAFERFTSIIHGENPDRVGIMAATGLRTRSQGGIYRRLAERGLCLRSIVPPHFPNFSFPGAVNPYLEDIIYSQKYYFENGHWNIKHTFETPVGTIDSVVSRNLEIDVSSDAPTTHFIKEDKDWDVINYIFRRMIETLHPNYEEIALDQDALGEQGMTIAFVGKTPYQRAWIEMASLQDAVRACYKRPPGFQEYIELQVAYHKKIADIAAGCPSDLVLINDNITNTISPKYYQEFCIPVYQFYADAFSGTNKVLAVHNDGLLGHIKDDIADAPFTVVDSFTLPPSGDISLAEAKEHWPGKILFINLPPFLAYRPRDELVSAYQSAIDEWDSKQLVFVHVEDYPLEQVEIHLSVLLDVCGY